MIQSARVELRRLLQVESEVAAEGAVGGESERCAHETHQAQRDDEVGRPGEQERPVEVVGPRTQRA